MNNKMDFGRNESNGNEPEPVPRKHVSESQMASVLDRRHLEDVTNYQQDSSSPQSNRSRDSSSKALIIDDALTKLDPVIEFENNERKRFDADV